MVIKSILFGGSSCCICRFLWGKKLAKLCFFAQKFTLLETFQYIFYFERCFIRLHTSLTVTKKIEKGFKLETTQKSAHD